MLLNQLIKDFYIIHFCSGEGIVHHHERLWHLRGGIPYYKPIEDWLVFVNKYENK